VIHIYIPIIRRRVIPLTHLNQAFSMTWLETTILTTTTRTISKASASKTSYPSLKKTVTNTTSRLRSVVTRPTPITETKEKETPRCQCSHDQQETNARKTNLPFCDLRHRLINGVGSRHHADHSWEREKKTRVPSVARFGRHRHQSTHRGSSTRPCWTRSTATPKQQKSPRERSGVWARLSSRKRLGSRSGNEPRSSRNN
jgi:hypothetical protein